MSPRELWEALCVVRDESRAQELLAIAAELAMVTNGKTGYALSLAHAGDGTALEKCVWLMSSLNIGLLDDAADADDAKMAREAER